jgi:hypothetical protein
MTEIELLKELERRFDAEGEVPFSVEDGALVESLSFTSRSLTRDTYKDAWNSFVKEVGIEHLGWPVHFGIALWYWDHEKPLHAAAVFEHIHRDVRQGYNQAGEVAYYQADYLPRMLQLYAELSDSERMSQLFGRLEELYEDGHVRISEYSDGLLAIIGAVEERRGADSDSLLHIATRTICDLRERLDTERREKEALKAEVDTGVRFVDACTRAEKKLRTRYIDTFPTFYPRTQQFLSEASAWTSKPFRDIGPTWSPILFQKALEYEFNERIWVPFRGTSAILPSELKSERLTINQIKRLLLGREPLVLGLRESVGKRFKLTLDLPPALGNALRKLVDHSTRARHGDRKAYMADDLEDCLAATVEGEAVVQIIALFHAK